MHRQPGLSTSTVSSLPPTENAERLALTVAALYEGVNESQGRVFPSSERRGGCAIKKMLRSLLMKAQTGWSVPDNVSTSAFTIMTTPSAPASEASRLFLTGAATPPVPGGEHPVLAIHSHLLSASRF